MLVKRSGAEQERSGAEWSGVERVKRVKRSKRSGAEWSGAERSASDRRNFYPPNLRAVSIL